MAMAEHPTYRPAVHGTTRPVHQSHRPAAHGTTRPVHQSHRPAVYGGAGPVHQSYKPTTYEGVGSVHQGLNPAAFDEESAQLAFNLVQEVAEAFSKVPDTGDISRQTPEESEKALLAIIDASSKTLDATEKSGFKIPYHVRERLDVARSVIPTTFNFIKQLQHLGGGSGFNSYQAPQTYYG